MNKAQEEQDEKIQMCRWCRNRLPFYFTFKIILSFDFFGCTPRHAGSELPDQGSNLRPQQWERGVLTTGRWGSPMLPP